jgi:hypothetical protein
LDRNLAGAGTATVTQGTANVGTPTVEPNLNQVTVPLTGVTNAQHLVITLNGVQDTAGAILSNLSGRVDMLRGDTSANKVVSNTDVAAVKVQVAAAVSSSNFRTDVNANGVISNTDVSDVKTQVGTTLP